MSDNDIAIHLSHRMILENKPYISFVGTVFNMITNCFEHVAGCGNASTIEHLKI